MEFLTSDDINILPTDFVVVRCGKSYFKVTESNSFSVSESVYTFSSLTEGLNEKNGSCKFLGENNVPIEREIKKVLEDFRSNRVSAGIAKEDIRFFIFPNLKDFTRWLLTELTEPVSPNILEDIRIPGVGC